MAKRVRTKTRRKVKRKRFGVEKKDKSVIDIIGDSFKLYWRNPIIILPFLFFIIASIIISTILVLIFIGIFSSFLSSNLSLNLEQLALLGPNPSADTVFNAISGIFTPEFIIFIIIAAFISILIIEFIRAYFIAGVIGMSKEAYSGRKTKLRTMNKTGKKFWIRYWLLKLVIYLGILIWLLIFSLPLIITGNLIMILIPLISILPLIFVYVLFALSEFVLVIHDLPVFDSIKTSIQIAKRNYWSLVGLGLLFVLMIIISGFIPVIGGLITGLIIAPAITIALTIFAITRKNN